MVGVGHWCTSGAGAMVCNVSAVGGHKIRPYSGVYAWLAMGCAAGGHKARPYGVEMTWDGNGLWCGQHLIYVIAFVRATEAEWNA